MNEVILIGRSTREVDMAYTDGGMAISKVGIVVDKKLSKDKKEEYEAEGKATANFINITAFRHTAEFMANYLGKGKMFAVKGNIETGQYKDKDGNNRYSFEVIAQEIKILEWKEDSNKQDPKEDGDFDGIDGFHPTDNDEVPF